MKMQIGKWGNSLAVRLPRELVERFHLKEGDAIDSEIFDRAIENDRRTRERDLQRIRELRRPLPEGYKFDRDEANGW